jgi:hypothetical protein
VNSTRLDCQSWLAFNNLKEADRLIRILVVGRPEEEDEFQVRLNPKMRFGQVFLVVSSLLLFPLQDIVSR